MMRHYFAYPPEEGCNFKAWRRWAQQIDFMLDYDFRQLLAIANIIEKEIMKDLELSKNKLNSKNAKVREQEINRLAQQRVEISAIKKKLSPKLREWRILKNNQHKFEHGFEANLQKLTKEISQIRLALADAYAGTPLNKVELELFHAYYERYLNRKPFLIRYLETKVKNFLDNSASA